LRAEGGKNIHFPARGSASEALAAFYQKICLNNLPPQNEYFTQTIGLDSSATGREIYVS
jgi:hypothetical protein